MSHTVVLHIGAMKSGTSFLQQTLGANKAALEEQGVLFPGKRWRQQVLGVIDALGQKRDGKPVEAAQGAWQRLLDEMAAWDGTSVISMEFLGASPREDIQRVVDSLAPARVKVVLTARDLGRNIPAMWQEGLKNTDSWTWTEFLDAVRNGDPDVPGYARKFWRHMNYPFIARKWMEAGGPENFWVVTVPQPGASRSLLLERFASVAGFDPAGLEPSDKGNVSVPAASAQVIRAVNERLKVDGFPPQYPKVIKHTLAKKGMVPRKELEPPIGFEAERWLRKRADQQVRRLEELGVQVVGDLDELRPMSQPGTDPSKVSTEDQLDAALAALTYLVRVWPTP
jgi:hypothetical protein